MKITLFDRNKALCDEWNTAFEGIQDVDIICCNLEELPGHDALVTAGNSYGVMTGGIDLAVRDMFGIGLQDLLQNDILMHKGTLSVGESLVIPFQKTGKFPIIIYTPTMIRPRKVGWSNAFYAAFSALITAAACDEVQSVAIPGLCTSTGRVPYEQAAKAMRLAYDAYIAANSVGLK